MEKQTTRQTTYLPDSRERRFLEMLAQYDAVVRRVCLMYSRISADYEDLYQETVANLWHGFDKFRGEARISTWIYRATVNTCITWLRRNARERNNRDLDEAITMAAGDDLESRQQLQMLYDLIAQLDPMEKALVMMWLDGQQYDEIADVMGISRSLVAVRLHRIKDKMKKMADA